MRSLIERFKEPSSWAGITGVLAAVWTQMPEGMGQAISGIGAGIAFIVSIFMKEKGSE
jgi:hypothetical protein